MQMIASNKLYLPILDKNLSKENNEKTLEVYKNRQFLILFFFYFNKQLLNWINNYNYAGSSDPNEEVKQPLLPRKSIIKDVEMFARSNSLQIPAEVLNN